MTLRVRVRDVEGRKYLDRSAGICVVMTRAPTCHRDLDGAAVGDLLHQPQQVDLIVSEADLHIVRTDGIDADGLAREDGQKDALSQVAVGREAEDI